MLREGADDGINTIKAWYNTTTRKIYVLPDGWHHWTYIVYHDTDFAFNDVMGMPVGTYIERIQQTNMQVPDYSDECLLFIRRGWVRIGYDYDAMPHFYLDANTYSDARTALHAFMRVCKKLLGMIEPNVFGRILMDNAEFRMSGRDVVNFVRDGTIPNDTWTLQMTGTG